MADECLVPNLMFACSQMTDYTRNRYRLDTTSSDTSGPSRILTVNLPEAAVLDLKSFRMFFKVQGTTGAGQGSGTDQVAAFLPDQAETMISKVEVYINGVQVSSGASEYNTLSRMVKIGMSSPDRNGSVDRLCRHAFVSETGSTGTTATSESAFLCISEWNNILGMSSTRFLPTSLVGQVQVRITFSSAAVLIPYACSQAGPYKINPTTGVESNVPANSAQEANATAINYSVSDIRFSIDAISVCPAYNQLLAEQLSREGELKLNYSEFYTFLASNITVNRFSLASSSIDAMWNGFRRGDYQSVGNPAVESADAFGSTTLVSPYVAFTAYDPDASSGIAPVSNLQYQYSINNVLYPQYFARIEDAMEDVAYVHDKVGQASGGILPCTRANFKGVYCQLPLTLCHPSGMGLSVRSGYNSRGVNSTMLSTVNGQTLPASYNNVIVVKTTAQLKIGIGRSLAIDF